MLQTCKPLDEIAERNLYVIIPTVCFKMFAAKKEMAAVRRNKLARIRSLDVYQVNIASATHCIACKHIVDMDDRPIELHGLWLGNDECLSEPFQLGKLFIHRGGRCAIGDLEDEYDVPEGDCEDEDEEITEDSLTRLLSSPSSLVISCTNAPSRIFFVYEYYIEPS